MVKDTQLIRDFFKKLETKFKQEQPDFYENIVFEPPTKVESEKKNQKEYFVAFPKNINIRQEEKKFKAPRVQYEFNYNCNLKSINNESCEKSNCRKTIGVSLDFEYKQPESNKKAYEKVITNNKNDSTNLIDFYELTSGKAKKSEQKPKRFGKLFEINENFEDAIKDSKKSNSLINLYIHEMSRLISVTLPMLEKEKDFLESLKEEY